MRHFTILLILCMLFTLSQRLNAQNHSDYRMASEEAKLRASRNLIEKLFGAWLIVATEVRDFQLQRETIIVRVYGKLYGVQFSPVVHDRENGLLLVNAQISKTDALNALKASGYTGGGALPDYIQAEGAAPYEGQGLRPRVESYERPLSLASSIGELIFRKAEVKAPTDMKKWEEVLKMIGHYSKQQVIEEKEKETFYVEIRLPQTEIEYILSEAVSPTQFSEALKNTEKVFKKGILAVADSILFLALKYRNRRKPAGILIT
jgi:NACalpha-BTF3-like transcription factor